MLHLIMGRSRTAVGGPNRVVGVAIKYAQNHF